MVKSRSWMLGLLLSGSVVCAACSSDEHEPAHGDVSGDAGAGGDGDGFEFPKALNPQTVIIPAQAPAAASQLLVAGTDYTSTEIASVELETGKILHSEVYQDGDTVPVSSAGVGFALQRTSDQVSRLEKGAISATFDLKEPGTDDAPVVNKAYVPFLNRSEIAILDLDREKVSRRLDLSRFNAPGDSDHSAEIADGVFEPKSNVVYFMLQRIDLLALAADPEFRLRCTDTQALIVGIDAATDHVLDLNGSAAGEALPLSLVNPSSLSLSRDGKSLIVSAAGCYEGGELTRHGVEIVDLAKRSTHVAYAPTPGSDAIVQLTLVSDSDALIKTQDSSFMSHWFRFDLATGTVSEPELSNVPNAVSFDGTYLLGVEVTAKVGAVVRYDLAAGTSTTVSASSWAGEYGTAAGTALVE